MKALGYGRPLKIELSGGRTAVFHTARPDDFGHDRRSDRTGNLLLAFDTFGKLPHHVAAIDMGLVRGDGALVSLDRTGEPYLITSWVDGTLYADELRHAPVVAHAETLARVLLEIHAQPGSHAGAYTRAIRDLLGHGEGIFGLVDSYPPGVVDAGRPRAIEEACLAWRWKLRGQTHRLRRTHGDFHPFNIVFAGDTCDVLAAVAPFYAWRALVLASPIWYPHLAPQDRDRILSFAERALAADRFDPTVMP
jgi:hypothetical protein